MELLDLCVRAVNSCKGLWAVLRSLKRLLATIVLHLTLPYYIYPHKNWHVKGINNNIIVSLFYKKLIGGDEYPVSLFY